MECGRVAINLPPAAGQHQRFFFFGSPTNYRADLQREIIIRGFNISQQQQRKRERTLWLGLFRAFPIIAHILVYNNVAAAHGLYIYIIYYFCVLRDAKL